MLMLLCGLILFLGVHALRIPNEAWREAALRRLGPGGYKAAYSLVSVLGLVLIVYGYGQARMEPWVLWQPPVATKHLAGLLTALAFVLLLAPYFRGNLFSARLGHPMVLGVKLWAFAHLLANGTVADVVLFGAFLLWAVLCFRAARRRQPASGGGRWLPTLACVGAGLALWAGFALWAHAAWIGVRPY
jgi:uncharacterized membrane protein